MPGVGHQARALVSSRRGVVLAVLAVAAAAVALLLLERLLPDAATLQDWVRSAHSLGVGLPVAFLLAHAVLTVTPLPRTAFTLAAGLLFGPTLGVTLALAGATASAVLALLAVRALGREAVAARLRHRSFRAVDDRLRRRGWLAVASLRLIPVVPFWLVNYACGVSAVRVLPFTVATALGALPGTVSIVLLGDAVAGRTSPLLLVVSVVCGAVGVLGLVLDSRTPVKS